MTSQKSAAAPKHPDTPEDPRYPWIKSYPEGVSWNQTFPVAPLSSMLDRAASLFPARPCTYFLGKIQTFAEIGSLSDRAALGLQKLGIRKGTRVGLFLPNSPTHVIYYFAILKAGATVVNYNPLYTVEDLDHQIRDSGTEIMVTLDLKFLFDKVEPLLQSGTLAGAIVASFTQLLPTAKSVLFKVVSGRRLARPARSAAAPSIVWDEHVLDNDGRYQKADIDPHEDVAVLQYTGGTTGTPKGAMLTHANLYVNTLQVVSWAPGLEEGNERIMGILPFFHVFAMTVVMNFSVARAAEMILMPRFTIDDAMKLIAKTTPTCMPAVPTIFNAILHHKNLRNVDLSSLKFCLSGGAPLPLEVKQRFETLTGCKVVEGYGLSETSPVATSNPLIGPVKAGSIGLPLPGTVLSIRAIDDPSKEVPVGTEGEVCIKGPQVMKGYWNKPKETAEAMVDGFFRSGDIGKMDEEGFFYITDRLKDMIICSGFKVFPRHVEEKIYQHPAVEEVTVIGIKDPYRGEAPKAFVKLKAGQKLQSQELLKFLGPKLSKLELPAEIEFRDELPKTPLVGKLSKKELKAEAAQASSQPPN